MTVRTAQRVDPAKRDDVLTIRLSSAERKRLRRVAKHFGLTLAGVVRMLVARHDPLDATKKLEDAHK